ncbi:putative quinol monooxygenase [Acetobacter indonesiensis]|jgi:quinol monooxygenase YgiN|nr:putative quinol monooxygenase [Acetobacter indonesiensis]MCI1437629.1 antibiotic biosynthesis monooxygenase [Acetobacter indonesiensis]MCI1546570.1 antibiotic biosynthesis monooxygenase [Acetobacter indonesiensis]MCI1765929.1 antibiotic biosynthesis monooxygenase [Acetobacter indonesiensis]OUI90900.1 antibiotic biosynthesis monooxygenase [Acetobacter indonesiensis]OUI96615.1 antibiotic biosynthesis monooxygenase [Acetobacter indonesiensis]
MSEEITVVAIVKAKKGHEQEVAQAMAACVPESRAESTNIQYVPNRDLDDPQTFIFVEKWTSRQALQDHMDTPHFKVLADTLKDSVAEPLAVHILQPLVA